MLKKGINLLVGDNGSGKSTLLKALCAPANISGFSNIEMSAEVEQFRKENPSQRYLSQSVPQQVIGTSLSEDVRITERLRGVSPGAYSKAMTGQWALYEGIKRRTIGSVSRGQLQSFVNTLFCLAPARITGIDEPDAFLDENGISRLIGSIELLAARDTEAFFIIASHRADRWKEVLSSEPNVIELHAERGAGLSTSRAPIASTMEYEPKELAIIPKGKRLRLNGRRVSLQDDVRFRSGEMVQLIGGNGAGKTTIMRHMYKCLPRCVAARFLTDWSAEIGDFRLVSEIDFAENAQDTLRSVGIRDDQPVFHLSWGQRRMLNAAEALSAKGQVVFLDEPFAGLSKRSAAIMMSLIEVGLEDGKSLAISNNRKDLGHLIEASESYEVTELVR